MTKHVVKCTVPVDLQPHQIPLGQVIQFNVGDYQANIWIHVDTDVQVSQYVQVFGTADILPDDAVPLMSVAKDNRLAYHLFEVFPCDTMEEE